MSRTLWRPYLPGLREPAQDGARVARDRRGRAGDRGRLLGGRTSSRRASVSPRPVQGFRVVGVERKPTYTLVLYRADRPTFVPMATLAGLALTDEQPGVLLQGP